MSHQIDTTAYPPDPYSDDPYSPLFVLFRHVPGHLGYGVDTDGNVWSCRKRGRYNGIMPKWTKLGSGFLRGGYPAVVMLSDRKSRTFGAHRVVARTFLGPKPQGQVVRHLTNPNPRDCRLANLGYGTHQQNSDDMVRHGTRQRGTQVVGATFDDRSAVEVCDLYRAGWTIRRLGLKFGNPTSTIHAILTGKTWSHATGITESITRSGFGPRRRTTLIRRD